MHSMLGLCGSIEYIRMHIFHPQLCHYTSNPEPMRVLVVLSFIKSYFDMKKVIKRFSKYPDTCRLEGNTNLLAVNTQ